MSRKRQALFLLLVLLLATLLRTAYLGNQSLRVEESFSLEVSRLNVASLLERTSKDVHPPLHLLLLHYWTGPRPSEVDVRSLSVVAGVLGVFMVFVAGRLWLSPGTALLASLLAAISPFHVWYSQETRPYAWLMLITLVSLAIHGYALQKGGRWWWVGLTLTNVLGSYLHYFFFTVILYEISYTVAARRRYPGAVRALTYSLGAMLLLYLPWVRAAAVVLTGEHGWSPFNLSRWLLTAGWVVFKFSVGNVDIQVARSVWWITGLTIGASVLLGCMGLRELFRAPRARGPLFTCAGVLLGIPLALAGPLRYAMAPKYVIGALPIFWWIWAMGVLSPARTWLRGVLLGLLLLPNALMLGNYYTNPSFARDDWRGMARSISREESPGEAVLFYSRLSNQSSMRYYYTGKLPIIGIGDRGRLDRIAAEDWLRRELTDYRGVWFVRFFSSYWDPEDAVLNWLEGNWRCEWVSEMHHRGARLYHFLPPGGGPPES